MRIAPPTSAHRGAATQALSPSSSGAPAAAPAPAAATPASAAGVARDSFAQEPSTLAKVGAFTKGALMGAVATPVGVAVVGTFLLAAASVSPFGAAGIAAMATLKTCMAGAFWVGGAVGGLAEVGDLKDAHAARPTGEA